MAMSKAEKNARARARYAEKKIEEAMRFPTVKHGPRYGGEGNQIGRIGPHPGPFRKRRGPRKPKVAAPAMVQKAVQRVAKKRGPMSAEAKAKAAHTRYMKKYKSASDRLYAAGVASNKKNNRSLGGKKAAQTRAAKKIQGGVVMPF